jgi:D5 N terminal like
LGALALGGGLGMTLPSIDQIAKLLGGEVINANQVKAPGPGHSAADNSMTVTLDANAPDGFIVHSFSGRDDDIVCKDYVRERLGLPPFEPKPKANGKANGSSAKWTLISEHIYRNEEGEPYLRVRKYLKPDGGKSYPQYHLESGQWVKKPPKGPKIPYRLPELLAAPLTTTIYFPEGEKNCDDLAKLAYTATTQSEGSNAKWTLDLKYFKDRHVVILADADKTGRNHALKVANALHGVAASIKIVDLYPEQNDGSDISDWLKTDTASVKFSKVVRDTPYWEPSAAGDKVDDAADNDETEDGIALAFAEQEQNNLRHIAENGRWLSWDKTHWRTDKILAAYRTARTLCRARGERKQKTVSAVVTLAKSDIRLVATMEQFDANAWLLNAENGTIDLKTGVERPADPNDYITKKTGCVIAPKGTAHPLWTEFLNRVMGLGPEIMSGDPADDVAVQPSRRLQS